MTIKYFIKEKTYTTSHKWKQAKKMSWILALSENLRLFGKIRVEIIYTVV